MTYIISDLITVKTFENWYQNIRNIVFINTKK